MGTPFSSSVLIPLGRAFICLLATINRSRVNRLKLHRQDVLLLHGELPFVCSTHTSPEGSSNDVKVLRPTMLTWHPWHAYQPHLDTLPHVQRETVISGFIIQHAFVGQRFVHILMHMHSYICSTQGMYSTDL